MAYFLERKGQIDDGADIFDTETAPAVPAGGDGGGF